MAYPVIEGSTNGVTSYGSNIEIPLPSSIAYDEYIIGFVATEVGASCTGIYSSSGNFYRTNSISDAYSNIHLTCFFGRAQGSSNDNITLSFYNSSYVSYIVYRISGHGMSSTLDFAWNYGGTTYHSSDFPMKGIAVGDSGDKLYITAVTYSQSATSLTAPSGFSSIIDNNYNGSESDNRNGIATSILTSTNNTVIDNVWGYSDKETQTSVSVTVRIKSGSLPEEGSTGIGVIVPSGTIGM
jgi:hypothetical protein